MEITWFHNHQLKKKVGLGLGLMVGLGLELEAENAHFQPSAWGFVRTKYSPSFANDGAFALRENIAAGLD